MLLFAFNTRGVARLRLLINIQSKTKKMDTTPLFGRPLFRCPYTVKNIDKVDRFK